MTESETTGLECIDPTRTKHILSRYETNCTNHLDTRGCSTNDDVLLIIESQHAWNPAVTSIPHYATADRTSICRATLEEIEAHEG